MFWRPLSVHQMDAYKVFSIFLLETVKLFHYFPKQEDLPLSQQSYFLEFSLLNNDYWSHPSATHAMLGIRTPEIFTSRLFSRQHPRPTGHMANIAVVAKPLYRNCFCRYILYSFYGLFLPLTARFAPCRKLTQIFRLELKHRFRLLTV